MVPKYYLYKDINQRWEGVGEQYVYDADAIFQSIDNILSTILKSRQFIRDFGSNLILEPFELATVITESNIYDDVIYAVGKWEPRVNINYGLSKIGKDLESHCFNVTLAFDIIGFQEQNFIYNGKFNVT